MAEEKHKPVTFRIANEMHQRRAVFVLSELDLSIPWRIDIRPYKRNRSLEQQSLYRVWCRTIAEHLGMDHEEFHESMKERYLVPILERDDEDFKMDMATFRALFTEGQKERAEQLAGRLKKRASTTWLNTKQFSEYMDSVETFATGYGIVLPQPEPEIDESNYAKRKGDNHEA